MRSVHSHVHALGQCRKIIKKYRWEPVISGDAAGAAREVAEAGDKTRAAISPPMAAHIYGLSVLAEDIEDEEHNTTRSEERRVGKECGARCWPDNKKKKTEK